MIEYPVLLSGDAVKNVNYPAHDGLGVLRDALSCTVTMGTDGEYTLDMSYLVNGAKSDRLITGALLRVDLTRLYHDEGRKPQFFRITEIKKEMTAGGELIQVHGEHLSYDMKWYWCKPVSRRVSRLPNLLTAVWGNAFTSTPFWNYTDPLFAHDDARVWGKEQAFTMREGVLELAKHFGACLIFDNLGAQFLRGGESLPVVARRGANLLELSVSHESGEAIDGVYVYFQDTDHPTVNARLVKANSAFGEWSPPHYTAFNYAGEEQFGNPTPADEADEVLIGKNFLKYKTLTREKRSITAKIIDPRRHVSLYDTIRVVHDGFCVDQALPVRKITFDALSDTFTEIELGDEPETLEELLNI